MTARSLAVEVLARVEATDAWLTPVLDARLSEAPLRDARDAALVTELCYGATRRRLALDFALASVSDRRLSTLEDRVLAALRVGAYQLFYTRMPPRAAVAETVEAIKELGLARASGFVNAVLRRLSALPLQPLPPAEPEASYLSVRESHPRWLVERWLAAFGKQRTLAMLAADNQPPALALRCNSTRTSREALLALLSEAGLEPQPTPCAPSGLVLKAQGRVESLLGFSEGLWQVQDEAAQLVVHYAEVPSQARVLDLCAAPGGKTCQLAERGPVVALDLHARKLEGIRAEAARLGLTGAISLRAHDATHPLPADLGAFAAVLLDAPCSGLGTLRRNPELRYRRAEEDIARLAALQRQLLERAQAAVSQGGLLVYAVCSTEPEEGPEQLAHFLKAFPDFCLEPPLGPVARACPLEEGCLRTLPGPEGRDGFFAARLRRS
ncbi:MAG: 16S rRNA (cytosine(967)-C(5))-methyltransferase RsmB [Myxococcaceae bacterium]